MIRVFYFKNNYGDELSAYLVGKLSGEKVVSCTPFSFKRLVIDIMICIRDILFFRGFHNFVFSYSRKSKILFAVGSIIGLAKENCIVWGSGITFATDFIIPSIDIRAVRGPLTLKRMVECGCQTDHVKMGDPGLLLPLIFPVQKKKSYKVGVIAHNNDFPFVRRLLKEKESEILLISLKTKSQTVESITEMICSCERIVSTSLHGLIVSHAYGIPALRLASDNIPGDGSKYADYFLSVGIEPYEPLPMSSLLEILNGDVKSFFDHYAESALPERRLVEERQKHLLESAPFSIKNLSH